MNFKSRKPEAPPWRQDKEREAILGFERRARGLRGKGPPVDFTLDSPALRVGAGKSGVGGGEWKVSSPQFSVLFYCQDAVTTQLKLWTTVVSHGHESHLNPLTAHKSHRHQMASRQSLFPLYPHFFHVRFQIIATNRTNCISLGACLQNRDTGGRDEETLDASILPY